MRFRVHTRSLDFDLEWMRDAACRQVQVVDGRELSAAEVHRLFFSDSDQRRTREQAAAKAICQDSCQVRIDCLDYAMRAHEAFGIWGGLTTVERTRAMNARRRRD